VIFFVGLHQPSDAHRFEYAMVSVNRLAARRTRPQLRKWIMDSGAFTTLFLNGRYLDSPEAYAARVWHHRNDGELLAAVTQDFMCETHMLAKTGLTIAEHQRLTIERYDRILAELRRLENHYAPWQQRAPLLMPVLQGYTPEEYVSHVRDYGGRLTPGMWVGVGSVCKRNSQPEQVLAILSAIHAERPDLLLHGFGLKITALEFPGVAEELFSSDSMAWSLAARLAGRSANDWREAAAYVERVRGALAD
jgi:hypothetical protein